MEKVDRRPRHPTGLEEAFESSFGEAGRRWLDEYPGRKTPPSGKPEGKSEVKDDS